MADRLIPNIFLVNAPAGSGKTTTIKERIQKYVVENPNNNVLCITYTNRAAEELLKNTKAENVYISTIHSYILSLVSPLFKLSKITDLYFELFEEKILDRIANVENKESVKDSNEKYKEKYGEISIEAIRRNFNNVSYAESQFTSLYTGRLSHDDLLYFANVIIERFPKVKKKISGKYQLIFIDEYQDTSDDVLNIFYQSVINTDTTLCFFGDKMQQIYPSYQGTFEKQFPTFTKEKLSINHRSIKPIVDILNNLYNDKEYEQFSSEENLDKAPLYHPKVIITTNVSDQVAKSTSNHPSTLTLHLFNRDKFNEIGAGELYDAINNMDKYSFEKDLNANDVLTDLTPENKDDILKILFLICDFNSLWNEKKYGVLLQKAKKNNKIFNSEKFWIINHSDKSNIKDMLSEIFLYMNSVETTIISLISKMYELDILSTKLFKGKGILTEYESLLNVKCGELISLYNYIKKPTISTQHGVKGESHESIIFIAKDSLSKPYVYMYNFFKLLSEKNISLTELEKLYYNYIKIIIPVHKHINCTPSNINRSINDTNKQYLIRNCKMILEEFKDDDIFQYLFAADYCNYISNPTVANAKKCFKENTVYGILSAYRLFYVGCSRARKNLTIIIDEQKINSFKDNLIKKLETLGFEIYLDDS